MTAVLQALSVEVRTISELQPLVLSGHGGIKGPKALDCLIAEHEASQSEHRKHLLFLQAARR